MLIDRRLFSRFDWYLFGLAMCLAVIGILTIYSATLDITGERSGLLALRQLYWLAIGLVFMVASFRVDYRRINRLAYPFYAAVLLLLILVPFLGVVSGGSQRWLHLGYFALQPSELSKLAIVAVLAKRLQYDEPPEGYRLRELWMPFLLAAPILLLILAQPDLGTAVAFILVFFSVVLMGGIHIGSFVRLAVVGVALLPIGWQFLRPYQQMRIWTFFNPNLDPLGAGYHVIQSKIAIGSGRLFGKGYLQGTQNRLDFLPAQHTDFVFSVFAEEWGFVGCSILLGLYLALILLSLRVVRRARDRFGALLAFGMAAILFWQVIINIAMVTGTLPVAGIPLPFLSYGGSSLVTTMVAVGILVNVSTRRFTF
ncbi:MAG: rod shape-determining protein RodA [Candidatus Binatia bacterium]